MGTFYALQLDGLTLEQVVDQKTEKDLMSFRHRVFRESLGWLPVAPNGSDRDEYDVVSNNLAICQSKDVVGSLRFTPGTQDYMLEKDFSRLLSSRETIRKGGNSAEISRFAVDPTLSPQLRGSAAQLLYLGLWQWAEWNNLRWMYFVVVPSMYRRLVSLGLPVRPLGVPRPLDGGVMSMAGYFDWHAVNMEAIHSLRLNVALPDACPKRWREYDYSH
ncbi:acyl-homoserine-lactone synthase [Chromobacterium sp. ASV23]|uniref:acyl-homoserine-lactone synthase n=1 Tax=Chromobacterium sp. ASV23 TaxID=2795110 RepID=UPI0018EA7114